MFGNMVRVPPMPQPLLLARPVALAQGVALLATLLRGSAPSPARTEAAMESPGETPEESTPREAAPAGVGTNGGTKLNPPAYPNPPQAPRPPPRASRSSRA